MVGCLATMVVSYRVLSPCLSVVKYLGKHLPQQRTIPPWLPPTLRLAITPFEILLRMLIDKIQALPRKKKSDAKTRPKHRFSNRRWYIRQHKNGRRIRQARVCQSSRTMDPTLYLRRNTGTKKRQEMYGLTGLNPTGKRGVNKAKFDHDSFPIAIDTCATFCMTNDATDFLPGTKKKINQVVSGLGEQHVGYEGTVKWTLQDDRGLAFDFEITGVLLVPTLPFRLLSPQHWAQSVRRRYGYCHSSTDHEQATLSWNGGENERHVRLATNSNIALLHTAPSAKKYRAFLSTIQHEPTQEFDEFTCFPAASTVPNGTMPAYVSDEEEEETEDEKPRSPKDTAQDDCRINERSSEGDQDVGHDRRENAEIDFGDATVKGNQLQYPERPLDDAQAEFMRWHIRLGHTPFAKLKLLARNGDIPARLRNCKTPTCAACTYGKMTRKATRGQTPPRGIKPVPITKPGDCVSIDQLESTTPGFIAQMKGWLTGTRYTCATVFTDHYSRLSKVYVQKNLTATENLRSKGLWEDFCKNHNVQTKHYHADNGHFTDQEFLADVARKGQTITFCGVNAHFQNGISEKRIRDLQEAARTSLLDAKSRWPKAIHTALWPYALRHANDSFNAVPLLKGVHQGRVPLELFADAEIKSNVKHFHPFGCPTYCLDNALASQQNLNKWEQRARLGIYLGFSPNHARNVSLVLNPQTGLVSPQFHTKCDDLFETVEYPRNKSLDHSLWQQKSKLLSSKRVSRKSTTQKAPVPFEVPQESLGIQGRDEGVPVAVSEGVLSEGVSAGATDTTNTTPEGARDDCQVEPTAPPPPVDPDLRRSKRIQARPRKSYNSYFIQAERGETTVAFEALGELGSSTSPDMSDPVAFLSKGGDPDTMYLHQAMKAPDRLEFIKAMEKEVESHETNKHWEIIKRSDVPEGIKPLPAVWSMKRKRRVATGEIYKHKARLNVGGHKQERFVNYWETYAPVIGWSIIRFFLILAIINKWHTKQYDFVLAYPQAESEIIQYMDIPMGFDMPDGSDKNSHCLKVLKNIYGQKQAGRIWNIHLNKILTSKRVGFEQSSVDDCLYFRGTTILLIYVDDCIMIDPDIGNIDKAFEDIKAAGLNMTDEGDLKDYLGVDVDRKEDGTVHMTQPTLIRKILQDVNYMERTNSKDFPALIGQTLQRSLDEPKHNREWEYRSVIGKLNYLEKSTRGELAFAVHQAARFSADPREPHSKAVFHICRYLAGTQDKGMIFKPDETLGLEVFADADLAGTWNKETAENDPSTARSRAGFLIRYAGCPILWSSKLITEICLSTTEAEYVALSEAMRQTVPMMNILKECQARGLINSKSIPEVKCTAFEDNSGALEMARSPKMRPRTKHINLKYHWFRSFIAKAGENIDGKVVVLAIDTKDQLADIFTKAVTQELFLKFRKAIFGW